jgi:hypothetical protein
MLGTGREYMHVLVGSIRPVVRQAVAALAVHRSYGGGYQGFESGILGVGRQRI